jgi:hypothetical protein
LQSRGTPLELVTGCYAKVFVVFHGHCGRKGCFR